MNTEHATIFYAVRNGEQSGVYTDEWKAYEQTDDQPDSDLREFDHITDALEYVYGPVEERGYATLVDGRITGLLYDDEAITRFGPEVSATARFILAVETGSIREVHRALAIIGLQALGETFTDGWHACAAKWEGKITKEQSYRIIRAIKNLAHQPD
jgi:hypothetical protein